MLRKIFKKSRSIYLLFFSFSLIFWSFLYFLRPLQIHKSPTILFYYRNTPVGIQNVEIKGKISPLAFKRLLSDTINSELIIINLEDDAEDLNGFSLKKNFLKRWGAYNLLNGIWDVVPDTLNLRKILEMKGIKRKLTSSVKIVNSEGYGILKNEFIPDSILDFTGNSSGNAEYVIPPFLYEIKNKTDTLKFFMPKGIYPGKIKFYIKAEPLQKVSARLKINVKSNQILMPDSVVVWAYVPLSFKDSISGHLEAFVDNEAPGAIKGKVRVRTKSEYFLILNYYPDKVNTYYWNK